MIKAGNFSLDKVGKHLVARCDVEGAKLPKTLWFASETDDEASLEIDEPNWATVSLLYPAMALGEPLVIDAKISPLLLFNLNNDAQHLLTTFNPGLQHVEVIAEVGDPIIYDPSAKRHSITGFSGGVDSSATYHLYSGDNVHDSMRISALSIYDVGALGRTPKEPSFDHLRPHFDSLKKFCDEREIEAFGIASNMREILRNFRYVHPTRPAMSATISLRNLAATLAMQGRVKNYYPSGNSGFADLKIKDGEALEGFETVIDLLFSTESMRAQTGAGGLRRIEKLILISDADFAHTGLNVCVKQGQERETATYLNCGKCWKCIETQIVPDALGFLEKFSAVFDTKFFLENREALLDSFVNDGVYDIRTLETKMQEFEELYRENDREPPSNLAALKRQLDEADPSKKDKSAYAKKAAVKQFLGRFF